MRANTAEKSPAMTYIRLRIGIAAELRSVLTFDFRAVCETKTHDPADVTLHVR